MSIIKAQQTFSIFLCVTTTAEDSYIKQLKQLRWGHIRHIQHEARKLADLEEFLEKCGEIEY